MDAYADFTVARSHAALFTSCKHHYNMAQVISSTLQAFSP